MRVLQFPDQIFGDGEVKLELQILILNGKPGDPFTGDPPQEPQGLNSVFDTDTSTINILENIAERLKTLTLKPTYSLSK